MWLWRTLWFILLSEVTLTFLLLLKTFWTVQVTFYWRTVSMIIPIHRIHIKSELKSGHFFCIEENIILLLSILLCIFFSAFMQKECVKSNYYLKRRLKDFLKKITGKKRSWFSFPYQRIKKSFLLSWGNFCHLHCTYLRNLITETLNILQRMKVVVNTCVQV